MKTTKINTKLFINDRIRPHPRFPLICRKENRPAHVDEKAAKEWLARACAMDGNIHRLWRCEFCGMVHHDCYPNEASGSSSGKAHRKLDFLARQAVAA